MPVSGRQKIRVGNRADGGVAYWTGRLYVFAFAAVTVVLATVGVCTYGHYARVAPPTPDLAAHTRAMPIVSRIYAGDGSLLGEFATEWRELAAFEEMPPVLVHAFLAAEDHAFYDHRGIYFKGIARAAWTNFVSGDFAQGGSTITQQVAKQFLGNEKSVDRKIKEAILARRLEAFYSKEAILSYYLNTIYLGSGAYGVRAAARRYFSKPLDELTLAEAATIAGLARAPSSDSPLAHPERARERRDLVLDKMARYGFVDAAAAEAAAAEELTLRPHQTSFPDTSPYFAEHIRRHITERYGADALLRGGLRIETTVEPVTDGAAYENVDFGVRKQDKRQGWRGPEAYLEGPAQDVFLDRARKLYGPGPLVPGRRYLGLVRSAKPRGAVVQVADHELGLPLSNMDWAAPWTAADGTNDRVIASATEALRAGDVVWVSVEPQVRGEFRDWFLAGPNPRWTVAREPNAKAREREPELELQLEQTPHPQGAIFTADHETGYVVAMVGGYDWARSEYNRVLQACRQPASTYKPIYYSAALDLGYGYDSLFNDIPRVEVDEVTGQEWTPVNLGGSELPQVTLEYALVFSKNVPSVAIFKKVGAENVEQWARKLGFTTPIIADKALALGASCSMLDELTGAFAVFARNGRRVEWTYVRRMYDRDGALLEDNTVPMDPMLPAGDRLDRVFATAGTAAPAVIAPRTAYLTSKLLRTAIKHGFASILRRTHLRVAGKTGTSSATMDTLFVAYTSRWITTVWLGDDMRVRPLGDADAAYITVVPMWTRYMVEVAGDHPNEEIPWSVPDGVNKHDRGDHSKGETAEAPMELVWHKKTAPDDGVDDLGGEGL